VTAAPLDLEAIQVGDWLTIADARGNKARGPVLVAADRVELGVFNIALLVARRSRLDAPLHLVPSLKVLDHQPQLFD
jgi:hypothetical protein